MNSNPKTSPTRRRLLIDSGVQGALIRRTGLYAIATAVYFLVIFILSDALSHPHEPASESLFRCLDQAVLCAPGLILLAPLFAYDLIHISNRFVGPMFRLRRELRKLSQGEAVSTMYSRQGDFWADASESFNRLRDEVLELRARDANWQETSEVEDAPDSKMNFSPTPTTAD